MENKSKKIKLNLGCGVKLRSGFINVDKYFSLEDLKKKEGIFRDAEVQPDSEFVQADILKLPFKNNFADYILCIDVIEHLKIQNVIPALKEMRRVLKPKGKLALMTIDSEGLARDFTLMTEQTKSTKVFDFPIYFDIAQAIYGMQINEGEHHRTPFNSAFFNACVQEAGFKEKDYNMTRIFRGGTSPKYIDGLEKVEGVMKYDMLLVEAVKV